MLSTWAMRLAVGHDGVAHVFGLLPDGSEELLRVRGVGLEDASSRVGTKPLSSRVAPDVVAHHRRTNG